MSRQYFEPDQIPKEIVAMLYLVYGVGQWNRGQISIRDHWKDEQPARKSKFDRDYEVILLAQFTVNVQIPEGVDPKKRYIEVLKNEKRRLLAQHHVELKSVQDRIDRVLAIESK